MAAVAMLPKDVQAYLVTHPSNDVQDVLRLLHPSLQCQLSAQQLEEVMSTLACAKQLGLNNSHDLEAKTKQGPKRPLNSFMAFRQYYSASLAGLTQKSISGIMVTLWKEDPYAAKWQLLAKAYSTLRGDREKDEFPLARFFEATTEFVGIIPAQIYMQVMGWRFAYSDSDLEFKKPQLVRVASPPAFFPEKYSTTVVGVDDIIKHSIVMGMTAPPDYAGWRPEQDKEAFSMTVHPTPVAEQNTRQHAGLAAVSKGAKTLANAAALVDHTETTYGAYFDPAGDSFELSYDPITPDIGMADHGAFDAYNLVSVSKACEQNEQLDLDVSEFIHDDKDVIELA